MSENKKKAKNKFNIKNMSPEEQLDRYAKLELALSKAREVINPLENERDALHDSLYNIMLNSKNLSFGTGNLIGKVVKKEREIDVEPRKSTRTEKGKIKIFDKNKLKEDLARQLKKRFGDVSFDNKQPLKKAEFSVGSTLKDPENPNKSYEVLRFNDSAEEYYVQAMLNGEKNGHAKWISTHMMKQAFGNVEKDANILRKAKMAAMFGKSNMSEGEEK